MMAELEIPHHVQITMPDFSTISQPSQIDPDVSSTLTDFLAYTEHLPSAIHRSMTLIGEQNRIASRMQHLVHDLLSTYSKLPTLKDTQDIPDAASLRKDISRAYERLEKARRMAVAESLRMQEMVRKDKTRLDVITRKLKAMPLPPSRDPTPEPVLSPQMRKAQPVAEKRAAHRTGSAPRIRGRKIMVPGEVLPPMNPDSPPLSDESDGDSDSSATPPRERKQMKNASRPRTPKPSKPPKERKEKKEKTPRGPRIRTPGNPGTNVHSSVAGISTSNALLALIEPPADAQPGSKWFPWKRITEFELAKLRKRMKKNAIWLPSPAMRNRELKLLGRGPHAMEIARQQASETGQPFIDEYGPEWQDPTRRLVNGAADSSQIDDTLAPDIADNDEDDALMNRGMRLNEAKKRKRERMLEEAAQIQAQLHSEQAMIQDVIVAALPSDQESDTKPAKKKRKRDLTPPVQSIFPITSPDPLSILAPSTKKLKLSLSLPDRNNPGKAASAEPPASARRSLRRGSNASSLPDPAPPPPQQQSASNKKRQKRPAPGPVTAENGERKVSVGKRKAAPGKKAATTTAFIVMEKEGVEKVDPDEPRYCLCGDVSWGTMIACDNEDVSVPFPRGYPILSNSSFGSLRRREERNDSKESVLTMNSAIGNGSTSPAWIWRICHPGGRGGSARSAGGG